MNTTKEKSLANIRTFARDLDRERGSKSDAEAPRQTVEKKSTPSIPAKKVAVEQKPEKKKVIQEEKIVVEKKPKPNTPPKKEVSTTPPPKKKEPLPEHLPAFHELKNATKKIVQEEKITVPSKQSSSKKTKTTHLAGASSGTIITDTKKNKIAFFPSVIASMKEWVMSVRKSFKKKKKPTYEVSDTVRRKGVIQKATSKTGTIFTADSDTLREHIRQRELGSHDDIVWSPYTETGYALLEGEEAPEQSMATNVKVEFKKRTLPLPIKQEREIAKIEPSQPEPLITPEQLEALAEAIPEPAVEESGGPETIIETDPETIETPRFPEQTSKGVTVSPNSRFANLDTNMLSLAIIGVILVIAVGTFTALRLLTTPTELAEVENTNPAQLVNAATLQALPLTEFKYNELVGVLKNQTNNNSLNEFYVSDKYGTMLQTPFVLQILDLQTNTAFEQTVSDVRILTTGNDRALIFLVTDSVSARGALLAWESVMFADVQELLSLQGSSTDAGNFVDKTTGAIDVRSLQFADGEIGISYAFINDNIVVVTNTPETINHITKE